ncbi:alpha/beta fold hydrolase [Paracoccus suum]|uniref:Alpha/beta fold hydrolase n=1 Tax=Paracoccus suum TaxID=2259340 RepID=A0A344PNF2_9RHOB|nr:alpha/beta hydrolase [Paracoccus suum]AXC50907.1 alpha/beta fold hydrolase [Paracoccus suum]
MTQFFEAKDGARLAYRDEGTGLPLLALAGLTRTMGDFDYLVPHLPSGVRLIRMDYRGRGESAHTGSDTYTVAQEGKDAIDLLDHLGVERAAVLGTSRGGLIGMVLGAVARPRMLGLALNDVGPELERAGLEAIFDYVGRNPAAPDHAEAAARMAKVLTRFEGVPPSRWLSEARLHFRETPDGLRITYDPALREAFLAAFEGETPDLWPLWGRMSGMPLCLIRGANSDLLSAANAARMVAAHPGMIFAEVPGRGHIPFLDEPEAVAAIREWLIACGL